MKNTPITQILDCVRRALEDESLSPESTARILQKLGLTLGPATNSASEKIRHKRDLIHSDTIGMTLPLTRKLKNDSQQEERVFLTESHSVPALKKTKRLVGTALAPEWQPNARHFELARDLGRDERFVAEAVIEMRDWAAAEGHRPIARKLSWDATFSNWMRRKAQRRWGGGPKKPSGPSFVDIALGRGHE